MLKLALRTTAYLKFPFDEAASRIAAFGYSGLELLAELPDREVFNNCLRDEAARVRDHGGGMALCLIDVDELREATPEWAARPATEPRLKAGLSSRRRRRCGGASSWMTPAPR